MKMDTSLRSDTETKYKELYNDMKSVAPLMTSRVIFSVRMYWISEGYTSCYKEERFTFWSKTITPREWACYYSMILKRNDFEYSAIADEKKCYCNN